MAKLQAKNKEQREHIEETVRKYINPVQCCCRFVSADVYENYEELVEINLRCNDCDDLVSVDLQFDMMAEIVGYLRSKNCEQEIAKYEEYNRLLEENRKLFNECERLKKENEILKKKTKRLPQIATLNKRIHQLKQEKEYLVTQLEAKLEEDARKYIIENQ